MYGKRKERRAREGPGGNEVVVRGLMEEEVQEYLKVIFWVCFVYRGGLGLAAEKGKMSFNNKKAFEKNCSFSASSNF